MLQRRGVVAQINQARGQALMVTGLGSSSYDLHAAGDDSPGITPARGDNEDVFRSQPCPGRCCGFLYLPVPVHRIWLGGIELYRCGQARHSTRPGAAFSLRTYFQRISCKGYIISEFSGGGIQAWLKQR